MYTNVATSSTPATILFVLDVSGSMGSEFGSSGEDGTTRTRLDVVQSALHRALQILMARAAKGDIVSPRYRIAIIGYSSTIHEPFSGFKTIDEVAKLGKFKLAPTDATDTALAFGKARDMLKAELANLTDKHPAPLVCHMTDGEYNGGDPGPIAREIMGMATADGNILVENIFVCDDALAAPEDIEEWPGVQASTDLANPYARKLFDMSSEIPDVYRRLINEYGYGLEHGARLMFPGQTEDLLKLGFVMSGMTQVTPG